MSGMHLSKEFFELLKAIGESKSKQEEDRIITREISTLKRKMETSSSNTNPLANIQGSSGNGIGPGNSNNASNKKRAKEFLIRMLYVEMLGHDAGFGYIKAVEMAASSSIIHKKCGYLLCSACLAPEHEFRFMLVNQMQRDLASSNVLEVNTALVACTNLITADMVPAISTEVIKCLEHQSETVRKKAVIAMHRFYQISPESVPRSEVVEKLRRVLCDRDPSVMGASINVIDAVASIDPVPFKDLVPSLVSILKQVIEHRLPSEFDYHRVPAPWIQMKLVRILASLGRNDSNSSDGMYEILGECMKRADVGINAGYAVVYECVRTITVIYPNATLLDAAAEAISRFITSQSQNLKYFGVTGLAAIVEGHPQYAATHQLAVIECLEDEDETLQRRTLDLLYKMTNPVNVQFITEKLLQFCKRTTEPFLKQDLTKKVCTLAERYAPNNLWYIETITELFEISGDLVSQDVAQNLMTLIADGAGEADMTDPDADVDADTLLRQHAVTLYTNLLSSNNSKRLPRLLIETMAWVLGEYGYLSEDYALDEILEKLCSLVRKGYDSQLSPSTRRIIVSGIMKLVAQAGTCPPQAARVIDDFSRSWDVDLQRRCLEFQKILTTVPHVLVEVLPVDASCEDVQVDPNLGFLDGFVERSLAEGARDYERPEDDDDDDYGGGYGGGVGIGGGKSTGFNITPYEKPTKPGVGATAGSMRGMGSGTANASGVTLPPGAYGANDPGAGVTSNRISGATNPDEPQLVLRNVANVWGKKPAPSMPAPAAVVTPSQSVPAPSQPSNNWSNSYNNSSHAASQPSFSSSTNQNTAPPPKTEEQIRKERMAAALFGGGGDGTVPPTRTVPARRTAPRQTSAAAAARSSAATASTAPTPAPAAPTPAPAPAPAAPEIDLLDLMSDPIPTTTTTTDSLGDGMDILTASPMDNFVQSEPEPVAAASPPTPPPPAVNLDPFADMDNIIEDAPLASLSMETTTVFEYNGQVLAPLKITTAQFGEKWGSSCPHVSPLSINGSSKISTLDDFTKACESMGAHTVESIRETSEGICAGMLGGGVDLVLIHGKVGAVGNLEATIKTTDATLSGCLAMYIQNLAS